MSNQGLDFNLYRLSIEPEYLPNCTNFHSRISKHPPPASLGLLMIASLCSTIKFFAPYEPTYEPPYEPPLEPTYEPTYEPPYEPSVEPTYEPTHEPPYEPTGEPPYEPTGEPKDPDDLTFEDCLDLINATDSCLLKSATDKRCPREEVEFLLYTRENYLDPFKLDQFDVDKIREAPFIDAPLLVIVHGFLTNHNTSVTFKLIGDFLTTAPYNVITVDWGELTGVYNQRFNQHCYYSAANSVPTVAHCVAAFINTLTEVHPFTNIHLLGHCLGAHVCLQASNEIPHLHRVTTFDPAGPLFEGRNSRYIAGTAEIIDSYHTSSNLGRIAPNGHVDVYFNNGRRQPGCGCTMEEKCSHGRAVEYFGEGLTNPDKMFGFDCPLWERFKEGACPVHNSDELYEVGLNVNRIGGVLRMITKDESPFLIDPIMYFDKNRLGELIEMGTCKTKSHPGIPRDEINMCMRLFKTLGAWP